MSCNHNCNQSMKEFHYPLPPPKPLPCLFVVNPFLDTQPLATTDLFSVTMVLLFLECHVSGSITCVTLNSASFTWYNKSEIQLHCCGHQQSIPFRIVWMYQIIDPFTRRRTVTLLPVVGGCE